ncbi:hypothetical protein BS78_06G129700 [Paspalum vaginatum]|nr:hypothetical protein BS78_06G129700 [Paspalum vaginatum]
MCKLRCTKEWVGCYLLVILLVVLLVGVLFGLGVFRHGYDRVRDLGRNHTCYDCPYSPPPPYHSLACMVIRTRRDARRRENSKRSYHTILFYRQITFTWLQKNYHDHKRIVYPSRSRVFFALSSDSPDDSFF